MTEIPRYSISELHLGNSQTQKISVLEGQFPDQSMRQFNMSYYQNVMDQRSREVKIRGRLMTSQSIEGRDFPDFEMHDAKTH